MVYFGWGQGKIKRKAEIVGEVKQSQMFKPNSQEWLLQRINPKCENCNSNSHYIIDRSFIRLLGFVSFVKMEEIFRIVCPNCQETIELDIEEYIGIKPFIKINKLLDTGKIDEYEYKNRLKKIEEKIT
ncbi:hypothetical protein [Alkaliphilus peptidifermentans]|uniref:Uncharacterized protein n=1 Tax=Alkaliphilus peptidifermentans DSM 18978 TaxID=1120976 RepID=A0A1G5J3A2_9FIRM|nr:hypothetical protein [Alkaliphilus peptidifermentans]SCY82737.1 hypothetical protein SAMN03080606_02645 [Alkaliphilus peptidifermentans DSM 18978]